MRSPWPLSVPMHLQSGTLHSLTSADHEPVATMLDPGAKQTNEMGRSSAKLESWLETPFNRAASRWCDASCAATSESSDVMRSRSACSRLSARLSESAAIHTRAALSSSEPSV